LGSDPSEYRLIQGAWVHVSARLPEDPKDIQLEPGAFIGADVEVGRGTWIGSGAVIYGPTRMGEKNQVWPKAVLGGAPQDLGYAGQPTRLEIGDRNILREGVTIHRASTKGEGVTRVGNDNFFMAFSHVGHDCVVEDKVIMANGVLVAGHCLIQSFANLSGATAIAQFVTVGKYAFTCGTSGVRRDLEPFISFDKNDCGEAKPTCINEVGLKRWGVSREVIQKLRVAYKVVFLREDAALDLAKARAEIESRGALCPEVEELLAFVERKRASRFGRSRAH
jgi:UDP-N-acetylglucosamine acyltransferase